MCETPCPKTFWSPVGDNVETSGRPPVLQELGQEASAEEGLAQALGANTSGRLVLQGFRQALQGGVLRRA